MPAVRKQQSPRPSSPNAQTAATRAVRPYQPSRVLAQMENATKKYPRFFHPHEVKSIDDSGGWEMVDGEDPDVFLVANDHRREEEKSEIRILAAPISKTLLEIDEGWGAEGSMDIVVIPEEASLTPPAYSVETPAPMARLTVPRMMEAPRPSMPRASTPRFEMPRSSGRPTMPLGGTVTMVLPEQDLVAQSFEALLARPSPAPEAPVMYTHQPQRLLPSVVAPPRRNWGVPAAAAAAFLVAGLAIFGGTHIAKLAHGKLPSPLQQVTSLKQHHGFALPRASQREVEHPLRDAAEPLEVAPSRLEMGMPSHEDHESAPAAVVADEAMKPGMKKTSMTGPSRARMALAGGDLETASALFEEIAENPATQTDGLWGLAQVAQARGDLRGAQARYRDILKTSPQYFPAKLGLADATWDLGDQDNARKMYLGLEAGYPAKMVPERVSERSKQ